MGMIQTVGIGGVVNGQIPTTGRILSCCGIVRGTAKITAPNFTDFSQHDTASSVKEARQRFREHQRILREEAFLDNIEISRQFRRVR
jgi:hypothetical protein